MEAPVRERFVEWWGSPENDRAPGMTCLRACEALSRGGAWQTASEIGSKGCGANMRVAPVGLIPGLDRRQRSGAAQLQSALTRPGPGRRLGHLTVRLTRHQGGEVENPSMFTLLPLAGVELPRGAGTLRFGMSEREAQWAVATLADVREGWVCGWGWAFDAGYGDLTISVRGGGLPGDSGLGEIGFERQGDPVPAAPGDVPVVWNDIDLFGYPIPEVEAALAAFHPGPELPLLQELGLRLHGPVAGPPGPASRQRPRHPAMEPRYLIAARLSHPERAAY